MTRAVVTQFLGDSTGFTKAADEAGASAGKFESIIQGIEQGVGQAAFGLLQTGISKVSDFLGGAVTAAIDEQEAIAGLTTTLAANVPGWDGNAAAIEDYIAQMETASDFSRGDLTASLQQLVGATHDVTKAELDLATATNVARLTGEDLGTATQLITDVEAGRFRGLTALGININNIKTSQQALSALNDLAANQDSSYIATQAAEWENLGNRIEDAKVSLGDWIEEEIEAAGRGFNKVTGSGGAFNISNVPGANLPIGANVTQSWDDYQAQIVATKVSYAEWAKETTDDLASVDNAFASWNAAETIDHFQTGLGVATSTFENWSGVVTRLSKSTSAAMVSDLESTLSVWTGKWDALESIATDAIDTIFGTEDRASALAATRREIADQRIILSSKKSTADQKADAKDQLLTLTELAEKQEIIMAGHGELTKTQYAALISELDKQATSANADVATSANLALAELKKLQEQAGHTNVAIAGIDTGYGSATKPKKYAGGGWAGLDGPELAIVGEAGPEYIVDAENSKGLSIGGRGTSGGSVRSGGGVQFIPIPVPSGWSPGEQQAWAQKAGPAMAKWMQQNGLLPRFGTALRG